MHVKQNAEQGVDVEIFCRKTDVEIALENNT